MMYGICVNILECGGKRINFDKILRIIVRHTPFSFTRTQTRSI